MIVPFFDAERFLEEAVASVLAQTYTDWELLLVDDGSTDGSREIARRSSLLDPARIRRLEHRGGANRGAAASRNLGLRESRGSLIALLDADDVWEPGKLGAQVERLSAHPRALLLYGRSRYWRSWNPDEIEGDFTPELGLYVEPDRTHEPPTLLILNHPLGDGSAPCPSSVVFRRELLDLVEGFDESFHGVHQLYEDQVFLAKVYLRAPVHAADDVWDRYRIHPGSCMARVAREGREDEARLHFLHWLERHFDEGRMDDPALRQALEMAFWPYRAIGDGAAKTRSASSRPTVPPVTRGEGHWEVAGPERFAGWAWDAERPDTRVEVSLLEGDTVLVTVRADKFRHDLRGAGKGDGYHAFTFPPPPALRDGARHVLRMQIAGGGFELDRSPRSVRIPT